MAADHVFVKADCLHLTTGTALDDCGKFVTAYRVTRRHRPAARYVRNRRHFDRTSKD
jgi:hypothetical protein